MQYKFKDILNSEIYESTMVMFVLGKYIWFSNLISDTLKSMCVATDTVEGAIGISDEFGFEDTDNDDGSTSNSVDFVTFFEVVGVPNINGRWFCKADLSTLSAKQKELLMNYIKSPNPNGMLVITSTEWKDYKNILKNRTLQLSKSSHLFQIGFPQRQTLKVIIKQEFEEKGIEIDNDAIEYFMIQMSTAYDGYEDAIGNIADMHSGKPEAITEKDMKQYTKGMEHYTVEEFVQELAEGKPKKTLKMMAVLEESLGSKNLVYQTINKINEYIEFRILINQGYIPINITYFFVDVVNSIPNNEKYTKMQEWMFRKKAKIASLTSLTDWTYMKLMLSKAIEINEMSESEMDEKCKRALCDICGRQKMSGDRLSNIIGFSNVLTKELKQLDHIKMDEQALRKISETIESANNQ